MPLKVVPRRDRKLHRLVKKGEILTLGRGEILFSAGEPARDLFLVRTGHLEMIVSLAEGGERVVGVVGPWEMTGEEALLSGTPRKTGSRAGGPTQVTVLDGDGVNRALRTASKTYGAFFLAKEQELALARELAGPRRTGGASRQLAALLLDLSDRLGRAEEQKGIRIPIRLTHKVLADLCGSHRSTVTTLLNDWIYEGVVQQEGGEIRILRPKALGE
jgi:CRP-like cAMP-binding protein